MKTFRILASVGSALSLCALFGCQSKPADKIVAQVGAEKIYQSDVDFLKRASRSFAEPGQEKAALENIIEARMIYQEAKKLVGEENPNIQQTMVNLQDRFLMRAFDEFYVSQNLCHTDAALQEYFDKNKALFAKDSCNRLSDCRENVAKQLYLKENSGTLQGYTKRLLDAQTISKVELAYVVSADTALVNKAFADLDSRKVPLADIQGLKQETLLSNSREGVMAVDSVREILFGKDSLAVGEVRLIQGPSTSVALKVLLRRAPDVLPEEGRDSVIAERFVMEFKNLMAGHSGDSLLQARYKYRLEPIRYPEVQKYYDAHAAEFNGAPLDSVTLEIESKISGGKDLPLDSNYVLATIDGKPFVTEKDVRGLYLELPERLRPQYPRRRRVQMISTWKLKALAARDAGLDKTDLFNKLQLMAKMSFYRKAFSDSLAKNGFFTPEDSLKTVFAKYGAAIFPNATLEQVSGDMGVFAQTPDKAFLYEYYREQDKLPKTENLDSIKVLVYKGAAAGFARSWFERFRREAFKKYPVSVIDKFYLPREDLFSTEDLRARADSMYANRNLSGAWLTWERIKDLSVDEEDSLYARSILELAKLDAERGKFAESEKEYAAFLAMWPESPFAEKAMFARGFQLRENLKKDTAALAVLTQFMEKYPKSDLRESVEWLIKDIQSGGKLSEELNRKISEQE